MGAAKGGGEGSCFQKFQLYSWVFAFSGSDRCSISLFCEIRIFQESSLAWTHIKWLNPPTHFHQWIEATGDRFSGKIRSIDRSVAHPHPHPPPLTPKRRKAKVGSVESGGVRGPSRQTGFWISTFGGSIDWLLAQPWPEKVFLWQEMEWGRIYLLTTSCLDIMSWEVLLVPAASWKNPIYKQLIQFVESEAPQLRPNCEGTWFIWICGQLRPRRRKINANHNLRGMHDFAKSAEFVSSLAVQFWLKNQSAGLNPFISYWNSSAGALSQMS